MTRRILMSFLLYAVGVFAPTFAEVRAIQQDTVLALSQQLRKGPVVLLMRHGEQLPSPRVEQLPSPALRKIAMMRRDENLNNPLTADSQRELSEGMPALRELLEGSSLSWSIATSRNQRAYQAAEIMANELEISLVVDDAWTCVDYPDEEVMSNDDLLKILPNGSLPWSEEIVDTVVGEGTYSTIHNQVKDALSGLGPDEGKIIVTHTQQINAICEQNGLPVQRIENYGFVLLYPEGAQLFVSGLYAD